MEKLTTAVARFLQLQIDAGVDAVQIFDSLGGMLSGDIYETASARWIKKIIDHAGLDLSLIAEFQGQPVTLSLQCLDNLSC